MALHSIKSSLKNIKSLQTHHWLVIIIVIAILPRLAMSFYIGDNIVNLPGTYDEVSYDMLAQQVLAGKGLTVAADWWPATAAGEPTAHWSYLYTFFLTGVYAVFGHHPLVVRIIQAILAGILTPLLAYRVGNRYFNTRVGLVTAGLAALYIYFIFYSASLITETFYIISVLWIFDIVGQMVDELKSSRSIQ